MGAQYHFILEFPLTKSYRYNINGFVEELPKLPRSRWNHACAALPATGVRPTHPNPNPLFTPLQAIVVAGGQTLSVRQSSSNLLSRSIPELLESVRDLSSVLMLMPGQRAWSEQRSLPRPLSQAKALIVGSRLWVIGGRDDDEVARSEVIVN